VPVFYAGGVEPLFAQAQGTKYPRLHRNSLDTPWVGITYYSSLPGNTQRLIYRRWQVTTSTGLLHMESEAELRGRPDPRKYLQIGCFLEWAMLGSNQRRLPCEGRAVMLWLFAVV